jgi:hypothetical protein
MGVDTVTATVLPEPKFGSAGTTYSTILSRTTVRVERSNRTPWNTFHSLNVSIIEKPTSILTATYIVSRIPDRL